MKKTREQIITNMCYTYRHDFGLRKPEKTLADLIDNTKMADIVSAGMTDSDAKVLWNQMAQIFDNCIAPYMEFKDGVL